MAVPKYNEFFPAILRCLGDEKAHDMKEICDYCANVFHLTEEDKQAELKSGKSMLYDRVGWARTYLNKAGLLESPSRANYQLTEQGKKAYRDNPDNVNLAYLQQFKSFQAFIHAGRNNNARTIAEETEQSPREQIEAAMKQLNASLADDLLNEIMKMDPYDFEKLVVELLVKMGYGDKDISYTTKKSSDGGIDGVVMTDGFGFNAIYTQAKLWKKDSTVSSPDVQQFLGALAGKGASKGIFVTTARFSDGARQFAERQLNQKIVLVDGEMLTNLMIKYNVGTSTEVSFEIKRVDSDFFLNFNEE